MNKRRKTALLTAAGLIVLGLVVFCLGFGRMGFDFRGLHTEDLVSATYQIKEPFQKISVETDTAELHLAGSKDDQCHVVCSDYADVSYAVDAENGTLTISKNQNTRFRLFSIGKPSVTVYLPEEKYTAIQINEATGDVVIPAEFTFERAEIRASTGDILWYAPVSEELSITTATGDVDVGGISPGCMVLKTDTGDISVSGVKETQEIVLETDTGTATLSDTDCEKLSVSNSTGDVVLTHCDGAEISVHTDTGDVQGTLASGKEFLVQTNTGDIDVPASTAGGRCEILTNTGDVRLQIAQSNK